MKVFVGYDGRWPEAYQACVSSIKEFSSNVEVLPLKKQMTDERREGSTEFTFTRFYVPHLSGYRGHSIFVDSDFIFLDNINNIIPNDSFDVAVCKLPEYTPKNKKFNNNKQLSYDRKNWSSLMVFNNERCEILTPQFIKEKDFLFLHQFEWATEIGSIDIGWNTLNGYNLHDLPIKAIHFTDGGPWHKGFEDVPNADIWYRFFKKANI